jgi:methionyl-tRNA formyltransferase
MGTPEFSVRILEALAQTPNKIIAVVTQPDRKSGRGQHVSSSAVKRLALSLGLDVFQPESLKAPDTAQKLAGLGPELIVVAAFGQLLPPDVLALPRYGCVNVHPSLLPRYRGASPIASAILDGAEVTGVTIMLMDAGMDSGPILSQREVAISADDTTGSLGARLAGVGAELLIETLPLWIEGRIQPKPQDHSLATYTRVIGKGDGEIDWRLPTTELWRRARAFDPWPGCYTWWQGKRLKLGKVVPVQVRRPTRPGMVVALSEPSPATVGVETADGVLGLLTLQLEGKREMSAAEFVRGQKDFIGSSLL